MKIAKILFTATLLQVGLGVSIPGRALADKLTPVVVFPAFHFTILEVKVNQQTVFPECPESGKFEDWYQNPDPCSQSFTE